ncbi:cholesterol 25-hydroxylase-like protein [Tachysurus fulvidraco]|uniref:cholesterol 25-hydroxylase-like protein n=1 Tax=Tachysurus fulvidraco TaxID=1234273 RepID=UPI000F4DAB83|nr:cholesterol 25-hydroxylase-like protein [Tachysurus fulvidraco]
MLDGAVSVTARDAPLLQNIWDGIRERSCVRTAPLLGACVAFSFHVLLSALFLGIDVLGPRVPWITRYRIHGKPVSLRVWFCCLARISWKYALCVLPLSACMGYAETRFGFAQHERLVTATAAPSLFVACTECFSCLLVFDTFFFVVHYTVHRNPWLFRIFHQSHHVNTHPFALMALDSSVVELVSQQVLAVWSTVVVGCHPVSEILFHLLNIWLSVEDHCGYDFPWALHRILPCFGGAPFHQAHHQRVTGNYAPYFTHWDLIFGTKINT